MLISTCIPKFNMEIRGFGRAVIKSVQTQNSYKIKNYHKELYINKGLNILLGNDITFIN